jgi:hypothetical protein
MQAIPDEANLPQPKIHNTPGSKSPGTRTILAQTQGDEADRDKCQWMDSEKAGLIGQERKGAGTDADS